MLAYLRNDLREMRNIPSEALADTARKATVMKKSEANNSRCRGGDIKADSSSDKAVGCRPVGAIVFKLCFVRKGHTGA